MSPKTCSKKRGCDSSIAPQSCVPTRGWDRSSSPWRATSTSATAGRDARGFTRRRDDRLVAARHTLHHRPSMPPSPTKPGTALMRRWPHCRRCIAKPCSWSPVTICAGDAALVCGITPEAMRQRVSRARAMLTLKLDELRHIPLDHAERGDDMIEDLPILAPDPARMERLRARCHDQLARGNARPRRNRQYGAGR